MIIRSACVWFTLNDASSLFRTVQNDHSVVVQAHRLKVYSTLSNVANSISSVLVHVRERIEELYGYST